LPPAQRAPRPACRQDDCPRRETLTHGNHPLGSSVSLAQYPARLRDHASDATGHVALTATGRTSGLEVGRVQHTPSTCHRPVAVLDLRVASSLLVTSRDCTTAFHASTLGGVANTARAIRLRRSRSPLNAVSPAEPAEALPRDEHPGPGSGGQLRPAVEDGVEEVATGAPWLGMVHEEGDPRWQVVVLQLHDRRVPTREVLEGASARGLDPAGRICRRPGPERVLDEPAVSRGIPETDTP
jgi:hypothetical protein